MKKNIETVKTIIETLPYIKEFHGKTVVVKYGGNAMIDESLKKSFALDIVLLKLIGLNPVIVHGGGPQIGSMLDQMGIKSEFIGGLRVTDNETMEIVEMVLSGKVNSEIVNNINMAGGRAVGLSGKDGALIKAEKTFHKDSQKDIDIDIGQVGSVKEISPEILKTLDKNNFIPVIAPIGVDESGDTYNINADTAAGKIAESLKAEKLILLTDVEGVIIDNKLASSLNSDKIKHLVHDNKISGGMIPKTKCCIQAVKNGVSKAHIIDGRVEHAVLLEIFTDSGIGTELVKS